MKSLPVLFIVTNLVLLSILVFLLLLHIRVYNNLENPMSLIAVFPAAVVFFFVGVVLLISSLTSSQGSLLSHILSVINALFPFMAIPGTILPTATTMTDERVLIAIYVIVALIALVLATTVAILILKCREVIQNT